MGNDALKSAQSPCLSEASELHYTLQEAADLLNISVAQLEHAFSLNHLPFVHQYGRKLIAASDLNAYRIRHTVSPDDIPE